jgi:NAD(P)-dependent dehydrogenase (short-subunit alcohol dehydrogenase family)
MKERTILITGANKGIGHEAARRLAELGHTILVGARDPGRGESAVASLRARTKSPRIHLLPLDVTDGRSIALAAERVASERGRLDVLVNNAATAVGAADPSRQDVPAMRAIFDANVFGVVAVTQAFLPLLRRSASARIVNVSSSLGSLGLASDPSSPIAKQNGFFAYACSKTALNAFTIRLAAELRAAGIKVSSACPGYVATDLNHHQGVRTVEEGAEILVRLSTLPDDAPSGGFFDDAGPVAW